MAEPTPALQPFSCNFFEQTTKALQKDAYKDVKIILSDDPMRTEFKLHKVILAAESSFFRKLFYYEPKDVYEIGAVSRRGFGTVLRCMYGSDKILVEFDASLHLYTFAGRSTYLSTLDEVMDVVVYLGCERLEALIRKMIIETRGPGDNYHAPRLGSSVYRGPF